MAFNDFIVHYHVCEGRKHRATQDLHANTLMFSRYNVDYVYHLRILAEADGKVSCAGIWSQWTNKIYDQIKGPNVGCRLMPSGRVNCFALRSGNTFENRLGGSRKSLCTNIFLNVFILF